jgi:DNA-binding response OmpR family regulator
MSTPTILIADDDFELRTLVERKLSSMQCRVIVAENGEQALSLALTEHPDLLLLDVRMPLLSGWEVAKNLRSKPEYNDVAIIMVTGIGEQLNDMTAPIYGADDHIDKPFQLSELEFKVRKVLSARRRSTSEGEK